MSTPREPVTVIPKALRDVVDPLPYWFVIGGQAVRCFCPYRRSRDVDFGVHAPENLKHLLAQLEAAGTVAILERSKDTVHLHWNGLKVSIFVLENLSAFVEDRHLTVTGILATKLHAILDRGMRRDFFDLCPRAPTPSAGPSAGGERSYFPSSCLRMRSMTSVYDVASTNVVSMVV